MKGVVRDGRRKQKQRHAAVTVTLGVDVIAGLNELVDETGLSFSELVDNIVRQYLQKRALPKAGDAECVVN